MAKKKAYIDKTGRKKFLPKYDVGGVPQNVVNFLSDQKNLDLLKKYQSQNELAANLGLGSDILRGTNIAAGFIADIIDDGSKSAEEREDYINTLQSIQDNDFVQNDSPIYTKYGGKSKGFPKDVAFKALREGKVNGKTLTKGQKKFFATMAFAKKKAQDGLSIEEVNGLPDDQAFRALIEAEAGEVYQQTDGQINKISEDGNRHEEGGEMLDDVQKVLEDTSTSRRDQKSKSLVVTPDDMQAMFGIAVKGNLSHSEALEVVDSLVGKETKKLNKKLDKIIDVIDSKKDTIYTKNSYELGLRELENNLTTQKAFDMLFQHQESLKSSQDMKNAKYGIDLPKAQDGLEVLYRKASAKGATKQDVLNFQRAFHKDPRTKDYAQKLVSGRGSITTHGKNEGYKQDDVRQNEDGLLGNTTKAYFNYFNEKVAASPVPSSMPDDSDVNPRDIVKAFDWAKVFDGTFNVKLPEDVKKDASTVNTADNRILEDESDGLRFSDVVTPIASYLTSDRIQANLNPAEYNKITAREENVLPILQGAQRDFNSLSSMIDNSGAGMGNVQDLFARKYGLDTQNRATVNDRNLQRQYQADVYNAAAEDKQSESDQRSRALFESQQLLGMEAERKQKLTALDELMQRVNLNRKFNREQDLLMKLFPNFNNQGEYNGVQRRSYVPSSIGAQNNGNAPTPKAVWATGPDGRLIPMMYDTTKGRYLTVNNDMNSRNRPRDIRITNQK